MWTVYEMAVQNFLFQDFVTICDPVRPDGSVHREMVVDSLMDAVAGARRTPGRHETASHHPSLSAAPGLLFFGSLFRTLRRHSGQLLRQRQSGSFTDVAASCLIPGSALRDGFSHVLGLRIVVPEALRRPSGQLLRQRQRSPLQTLRRLFGQLLRQRQSLVDLSILGSSVFSRLG